MSIQDKSFFKRLNARLPWLKIVLFASAILIVVLDLVGLTISKIGDPSEKALIAPMLIHVKATERPERILTDKKLVALTFDDGPSSETTPGLLELLYEKNVPATFFMLGARASANPDIVRQAKELGNEIASHTYSHQNLIRITAGAVAEDIAATNAVFSSIIGETPALTRPPYGNINDNVRKYVGTPMILWSVDTLDWKYKTTESIMSYTRSEIYDGAIILMHDIHPTSVAAVPTLIDELRSDGYEFVTVSELATLRGINLTSGVAYYSFRP